MSDPMEVRKMLFLIILSLRTLYTPFSIPSAMFSSIPSSILPGTSSYCLLLSTAERVMVFHMARINVCSTFSGLFPY